MFEVIKAKQENVVVVIRGDYMSLYSKYLSFI